MVQPLQTLATTVRPATNDDRSQLDVLQTATWGEPIVAGNGRLYDLRTLPTIVAVDAADRVAGALTYQIVDDAIEIVSIEVATKHSGVGTKLLEAAADVGIDHGARRLWLVTTNDNLDALRFYLRRGLRILGVRTGGVDISRQLKPSIPMLGMYGIPMHDEILLGRDLRANVEL